MSKYSITYDEQLQVNQLEDAINDIDKRLTALEGKQESVDTSLSEAVFACFPTDSITELCNHYAIAYQDTSCVQTNTELMQGVVAELTRRITEAAVPTKRQQVAQSVVGKALVEAKKELERRELAEYVKAGNKSTSS